MSQHDYNIANGGGAAVRADINNALAAILSQNSGATAPTTTKPFMLWYDTANSVLKVRNAADNAWITFMTAAGGITGPAGLNISGGGWGVLPYVANSLVIDNNSGQVRFFATGADGTTDGTYIFYTSQTDGGANERFTVDSNSLNLTGLKGIKFQASQSASSDVNTLDDYEEGTWTPVIAFGGGTTGMTFTGKSGTYTKIGRLVYCTLWIQFSAKGSSTGTAAVTGLPFTPLPTATVYTAPVSSHWFSINTIAFLGGYMPANDPTLYLSGGVPPTNNNNQLTNSNFNDNSYFMMNFSYQV